MHFSVWDFSFFFVKYGARPFFARPFFKARIFFHNFFLYIFFIHFFCPLFLPFFCFQDKVKQLSSWKFFDWNKFGNRFGNDVSKLKKQ